MEDWKELLQDKGFTLKDVQEAFRQKIEYLRESKKTVSEKLPLGGHAIREVGKFVTHVESSYPVKMHVWQEIGADHIRLAYYVVSLKRLKEKGKLHIWWGQFNASIEKGDLRKLIGKAEKAGML